MEEEYTITHKGNFEFDILFPDGRLIDCGKNLIGMIGYTYFNEGQIPEIGWKITKKQLIEDYFPKMVQERKSM